MSARSESHLISEAFHSDSPASLRISVTRLMPNSLAKSSIVMFNILLISSGLKFLVISAIYSPPSSTILNHINVTVNHILNIFMAHFLTHRHITIILKERMEDYEKQKAI